MRPLNAYHRCVSLGWTPLRKYVAYAASWNRFPDRARFEVGDAQQLHFEDTSFDAALSLLVFIFIPDPKKALEQLCGVTRPGGKLAAAVWDYGAGMRMLRMVWDTTIQSDPPAEKLDEEHMPLCRARAPYSWRSYTAWPSVVPPRAFTSGTPSASVCRLQR